VKCALVNVPAPQKAGTHDLPDYPQMGLGYVAASMRVREFECQVIDAKLERMSSNAMVRIITEGGYNIVGFSAMTYEIAAAGKVAALVKTKTPSIVTVVGGVHATALPSETLGAFPSLDFFVYDEGEVSLGELFDAIRNRTGFDRIEGLAQRDGESVIVNRPRPWVANLDSLSFPDYSQFPAYREYHVITARGCPCRCIFCRSPYGRMAVRERFPEHVVEELAQIENFYPLAVKFNDETFGMNRRRAVRMLGLIREESLQRTREVASMRADHVDAELLEKMKEAGFCYIDYGVETGNPDVMKKTRKRLTLERVEVAIRLTKHAGLKEGANFIVGHPDKTWETAMQTINFAVRLNADVNAIGLMVPYPGTEVTGMVKSGQGGYRWLSFDWADYDKQLGNALELQGLSRRQMERLQLIGYLKIPLWNLRVLGFLRFCWAHRRAAVAYLRKAS
jgi:radical SAM superfamily enzyme YgiQ (UPF0313 family)